MHEINGLERRKWATQEPDSNPNATTIASSSTRGLVHRSPTEPSGRASGRGTLERGTLGKGTLGRGTLERGTLGKGTLGRGTLGRETSERGILGRLSLPDDLLSSCWSTYTSKVFPAAPASGSVSTAGRGICRVTSTKCSNRLRGSVSGVHGRGRGSGVCGCGACASGCGHEVCLLISWNYSGSTIGWSSTIVSTS